MVRRKTTFVARTTLFLVILATAGLGCALTEEDAEPTEAPAATEPVEAEPPTPTRAPTEAIEEAETMTFELTSDAFAEGEPIPERYSCDGENMSPPLEWSTPPEGTQALALVMDDPDAPAGTWDHWLVYGLPGEAGQFAEGQAGATGGIQGLNSWEELGYGGPCPPGGTHRYFFRLYALDTDLELAEGADKAALLAAMEGHILAQAELMGTYSR